MSRNNSELPPELTETVVKLDRQIRKQFELLEQRKQQQREDRHEDVIDDIEKPSHHRRQQRSRRSSTVASSVPVDTSATQNDSRLYDDDTEGDAYDDDGYERAYYKQPKHGRREDFDDSTADEYDYDHEEHRRGDHHRQSEHQFEWETRRGRNAATTQRPSSRSAWNYDVESGAYPHPRGDAGLPRGPTNGSYGKYQTGNDHAAMMAEGGGSGLSTAKGREWNALIRQRRTLTPPVTRETMVSGGDSRPQSSKGRVTPANTSTVDAGPASGSRGATASQGPEVELTELRVQLREQRSAHERELAAKDATYEARLTAARETAERRIAQSYQDGIASVAKSKDELTAKCDRVANERDTAQAALKDTKARAERLAKDMKTARQDLATTRSKQQDSLSTIQALEGDVRRLQQRVATLEDQKGRLEQDNKHLSTAIVPLKERDGARSAEILKLQDELLHSKHERERLDKEYTDRMVDFDTRFQRTNEEMAVFCERVNQANEKHSAKEQALKERLAKKREEVKALKAQVVSVQQELVEVQQQRAELVATSAKDISILRSEVEEKNSVLEEQARRTAAERSEWALLEQELLAKSDAKVANHAKDLAAVQQQLSDQERQTRIAQEETIAEVERCKLLEERLSTYKQSSAAQMRNITAQQDSDAAQILDLRKALDESRALLNKAQHDLQASTTLRGELSLAREAKERAERELVELKKKLRPLSAAMSQSVKPSATSTPASTAQRQATSATSSRRHSTGTRVSASHNSSTEHIAAHTARHASPDATRRIVHKPSDATSTTIPAHEHLRRGLEELSAASPGLEEPEVVKTADAMAIQLMRNVSAHEAFIREAKESFAAAVAPLSDDESDY